jgi:hypothetical protein
VGDNPDMLLPSNLDIEVVKTPELEVGEQNPSESIKDSTPSPQWTEVVKRGKIRSRSNKVSSDERRIWEY